MVSGTYQTDCDVITKHTGIKNYVGQHWYQELCGTNRILKQVERQH